MLRILRSKKGMSIVEVLVAAGLVAIISLGVATMLSNAASETKRLRLFNTLKELKAKMELTIRDQSSWGQTIAVTTGTYNSTATFNQIRAKGLVTAVPYTAPEKIILFDGSGNIAYNLLDWAGTGTNGFTLDGGSCTTFSAAAGAGSDACPISYKLVDAVTCPNAAASCITPQIRVVARLVFNPSTVPSGSTVSTLMKFKTLIGYGDYTTISGAAIDGKYDAVVSRTPTQSTPSFKLTAYKTAASGGCATAGAGQCSQGADAIHSFTTSVGYTVDSDSSGGSLVTAGTGANGIPKGYWTFGNIGQYSCKVTIVAFSTGGMTAGLWNANGGSPQNLGYGSTTAGQWAGATAIVNADFAVTNTTHQYYVTDNCASIPSASAPGDTSVNLCSLGMAQSPYAGVNTPIVTVDCNKLSN
ncbi:MAG: type II secretion system protein [Pseudobdellovibrio sp.]